MKKLIYTLTFTFLLTVNIFAQEQSETTWETYTTEAYEVKYPSDWDFNNSAGSMMDFLALCPLESEEDKLRENINLVKESAQDLSLEAYFESSKQMLEKIFPEIEIISTEDIIRNDIPLKMMSYTAKFGEDNLYLTQCYGIYNNVAYVLTYTSEKDNHLTFEAIENEILESFTLLSK